jgi:hypothetical protein
MTTKTKTKAKSAGEVSQGHSNFDEIWARERALTWAIDVFKQPLFAKEANAYSIVSLADTFVTFTTKGRDAVFPGAATPVATQD